MSALDSWQEEKQSSWLYRLLANAEPDAGKRRLFEQLATAPSRRPNLAYSNQATGWRRTSIPVDSPGARGRVFDYASRSAPAASVLAAMKVRGLSVYRQRRTRARHADAHRSRSAAGTAESAVAAICALRCSA